MLWSRGTSERQVIPVSSMRPIRRSARSELGHWITSRRQNQSKAHGPSGYALHQVALTLYG